MIVQAWRKKRMPSQREQYGDTVHLFIGTRHNPCKITFMPFTLDNNSIVICRGLNSLFIFKSVSPSAVTPKLSCLHLRRCTILRIILVYCDADLSPKIPVHTLYSRNTIKSCFWGPSDAEGPQHRRTTIFLSQKAKNTFPSFHTQRSVNFFLLASFFFFFLFFYIYKMPWCYDVIMSKWMLMRMYVMMQQFVFLPKV
jgi:hypothetical protein